MARPTALFKRLLIFVHRWIGVALSIVFLLWFASGIVMMYWTFPAVTADDRIERLPILERNWVSRWLYHGLHSLDFPWLYNYRPLWDIVVITLMFGGTALCVTTLVLTWRVLKRKVAAVVRTRFNTPNQDLAIEA